jgi:hypothetical protein
MAEQFKNVDPLKVAQDAERDLNSTAAKQGHGGSDSSTLSFTPISHFGPSFPLLTNLNNNPILTPLQQPTLASTNP